MPRFSAKLMEHFDSPKNAGEMETPSAIGVATRSGRAPRITVFLKVEGDLVARSTFTAFGCGVTIACCSAITELVQGQSLVQCHSVDEQQVMDALDGLPADKRFCASLAVEALRDALTKLTEAGS